MTEPRDDLLTVKEYQKGAICSTLVSRYPGGDAGLCGMEHWCKFCKSQCPAERFSEAGKRGRYCRSCASAYVSARWAALPVEERRARTRRRHEREGDRGRLQRLKIRAAYRRRNKKKLSASEKVAWAIKSGRLTRQPCEVCQEPNVVAHHDDYDKPLDIKWFCRFHHSQHHREHGEGRNPR